MDWDPDVFRNPQCCVRCGMEKKTDELVDWPRCYGCELSDVDDADDEPWLTRDDFDDKPRAGLYCPQCWEALQDDPNAYVCKSACCQTLAPLQRATRCGKDCLIDGYYCANCREWSCTFAPRPDRLAFHAVCGTCGGWMHRLERCGLKGASIPPRCGQTSQTSCPK